MKVGLNEEELERMCHADGVGKVSRRDLATYLATGMPGATTVTTTMIVAAYAGIRFFATGGIGGVHRGAETTMDISADLQELANTPVCVICAGAKSILDLGLTLEYLETKGVPVIGYGTDELPAFYTRHSGFGVDYRADSPEELAAMFKAQRDLGLKGGMLVTNPIPEEYSMDKAVIDAAIDQAIKEASEKGIKGKETTPFLLAKVVELTGGDSLRCVTNFYVSPTMAGTKHGIVISEHGKKRYENLRAGLLGYNYRVTPTQAKDLLKIVAQGPDDSQASTGFTQWSEVYNLSKKTVSMSILREWDKTFHFKVE